jgi:hypothetical protein
MPTMLPQRANARARARARSGSSSARIDSPAKNIEKCSPSPRGLPAPLTRVIKCRNSCDVSRAREGARIDPRSPAGSALKRLPYSRKRRLYEGQDARDARALSRCVVHQHPKQPSVISSLEIPARLFVIHRLEPKRYAEMREGLVQESSQGLRLKNLFSSLSPGPPGVLQSAFPDRTERSDLNDDNDIEQRSAGRINAVR